MKTATALTVPHDSDHESKPFLGFWIYLMTDLVLFATLFATYAVLRNNKFGGPSGQELFELPYIFVETLVLLTSSFTCGLAVIAARSGNKNNVMAWLAVTLALGLVFVGMELNEFMHLVSEGSSWQRSGFLSAFFTLVGTHGLHISIGLLWIGVLIYHLFKRGLTIPILKKIRLFSMFWHFLDIVWILIFTFVYLMGAAAL